MTQLFDPSIESEIRNHAWNHFALHAQQRMSAFQFFITIETGLIGATILILQSDSTIDLKYTLIAIGPMICLLAFVFWKIDQRTRDLISQAEESLKDVEEFFQKNSSIIKKLPFTSDPQKNGMKAFPLISGRLSYSQSFGTIFLVSGIVGAILTIELTRKIL
jgi:hypothetical protein